VAALGLATDAPGSDRLTVEVTMGADKVRRDLRIFDASDASIDATKEAIQPLLHRPRTQQPPYSSIYPPPPRPSGLFGEDPMRLLPGHTPEGGDQVGPHHPMFGDPHYDPLGPGNVGEPDYDHEVPQPFGQRPRPRGPPGFPPPAGGGFGPGRFGGPRML
jgi:hypothetical protein